MRRTPTVRSRTRSGSNSARAGDVEAEELARVALVRADAHRAVHALERGATAARDPVDERRAAHREAEERRVGGRVVGWVADSLDARRAGLRDESRAAVGIAHEHLATRDSQRRAHHLGDRAKRVFGARRVECLGADGGEPVDFGGTLPCFGCVGARAVEQLRRDDTRHEESAEHQPVERLGDGERVIRRNEEEVEADEGDDGKRDADAMARARAGAEHDEEVREGDVRLVEPATHGEHRDRDGGERAEPRDPRKERLPSQLARDVVQRNERAPAHVNAPSRAGSRPPAR